MFHSYTHKHFVWQFYMFVCVWESIHVCKTSHCSGNHCAPTADAGGTLSLRHLLPTAGPAVRTGRAEFVPAARCGGGKGSRSHSVRVKHSFFCQDGESRRYKLWMNAERAGGAERPCLARRVSRSRLWACLYVAWHRIPALLAGTLCVCGLI